MRVVAMTTMCLGVGLLSAACARGNSETTEDSTNTEMVPQDGVDATNPNAPDAQGSGAVSFDSGAASSTSSSSTSSLGADASSAASSSSSSSGSSAASGGSSSSSGGSSSSSGGSSTSSNGSSTSSNDASPLTTGANDAAAGGPVIGGCSVFPPDNPWNARVDNTTAYPVHPNSATYIASIGSSTHLHADWGDWSVDHYGIPWQTVPGTQPFVSMVFADASESDPGPYPFPPTALIEGGAGSGGDMHVLVLDTGKCTLYETYDSTYVNPGWSCGSGAVFNLSSDALRQDGWTSADAAGLPILPGLVRLAEVQAGVIQHALRFTVNSSQQGYIHPATHAAGTADASLPPMGLRLRLKASFDLSPFSGPALVILTAMQQYGLILADNGGNWFVTGDSDDGWTPLMDGITSAFSQVFGSDFEAVYTGPISTTGL